MHLTEWARRQGVHPHAALRWFENGTLPVPAERVGPGTILVNIGAVMEAPAVGLGLDARVSSHDQRPDLERQVARLTKWAAETGRPVVRVESEMGSGLSGHRPKLRRLLSDPKVTTVVVEHRDRLARLNAELVEATLLAHGRPLVVLEQGEAEADLVRDMEEELTSFCARLDGRRSARKPGPEGAQLRRARRGAAVAGPAGTFPQLLSRRVRHPIGLRCRCAADPRPARGRDYRPVESPALGALPGRRARADPGGRRRVRLKPGPMVGAQRTGAIRGGLPTLGGADRASIDANARGDRRFQGPDLARASQSERDSGAPLPLDPSARLPGRQPAGTPAEVRQPLPRCGHRQATALATTGGPPGSGHRVRRAACRRGLGALGPAAGPRPGRSHRAAVASSGMAQGGG